MRVKYNRVSTLNQTGNRFDADKTHYDLVLLDRVSGTVPFVQREKAKILVSLVESNKVSELHVEELSRLGRHTGNVISTLEWLEKFKVNVVVRNLGLQSRPNNKKNKIWDLICATMASLYSMELENIKERTSVGRMVYVQGGGRLGRPCNTNESHQKFLNKKRSQDILKYLNRGMTYNEVAKVVGCSFKTIAKVKKLVRSI